MVSCPRSGAVTNIVPGLRVIHATINYGADVN